MRQLARLSAMFFVLVAIGCAGARGPSVGRAIEPAEAIGSWSLADDENATFDVRLSARGTAVSNWSKGPASAEGEQGSWRIVDGRIVIDYTDGWRDVIVADTQGRFRKESFAPKAPRDGAPTNATLAVRTPAAFVPWVGVFEVPVAESRFGREFHVAIQSNHLAWKSLDEVRVGSWWIAGDALRIRWANGWLDEMRPLGPTFQVRSWKPGTPLDAAGNPSGEPTNTGSARRVE